MPSQDPFSFYKSEEAPPRLLGAILQSIKGEKEIRSSKRRIFWYSLGIFSFGIASIPAFAELANESWQSGFHQFLALPFSDFQVVTAHLSDFAMSLVESFPVLGVLVLLATVFPTLLFLRSLFRDINNVSQTRSKQLMRT